MRRGGGLSRGRAHWPRLDNYVGDGGHAGDTDYDGEAGEAVRARVVAVGDERRGADPLPRADPGDGDSFVADKSDRSGNGRGEKAARPPRLDQPGD